MFESTPSYKQATTTKMRQMSLMVAIFIIILDIWPSSASNMRPLERKPYVSCIAHDTKFTCDCRNSAQPMLLPPLIGYVFQVEITDCNSLDIEANTLTQTQGLRKITFKNVHNLILNKYALAFPRNTSNTPLIIEFQQVGVKLIDSHAIDGNIEEISFIGGSIDAIRPFGLTTIKDRAILLKLEKVWVRRIEPQAFKKFAVEEMEILHCTFEENLPSKAFYELEVIRNLRLHNNNFKEVHTLAFSMKLIFKLSIASNHFAAIDGEWLKAYVSGGVTIQENTFGNTSVIAFKGIQVHRDYLGSEPLELKFFNNSITSTYHPVRPLEFNERFSLNIKSLYYRNYYECSDLDRLHTPAVPTTAFFQQNLENIYFLTTSTSNNVANNQQNQRFLVLSKIIATDCHQTSYFWYIILGIALLLIILIFIGVTIWLVHAKRKRKRQKLDIVRPEPRTYTETQIIYQIENAGLLKTDL